MDNKKSVLTITIPCEVESIVYSVEMEYGSIRVDTLRVESFDIGNDGVCAICYLTNRRGDARVYNIAEFGEKVFCTKTEVTEAVVKLIEGIKHKTPNEMYTDD